MKSPGPPARQVLNSRKQNIVLHNSKSKRYCMRRCKKKNVSCGSGVGHVEAEWAPRKNCSACWIQGVEAAIKRPYGEATMHVHIRQSPCRVWLSRFSIYTLPPPYFVSKTFGNKRHFNSPPCTAQLLTIRSQLSSIWAKIKLGSEPSSHSLNRFRAPGTEKSVPDSTSQLKPWELSQKIMERG